MAVTLTIVRHGNTFEPGEPPRRIGARTDLPLVESGRAQATALGRAFATRKLSFTSILCSPLARTRETAALILDHLPPAPQIDACDWLAEIDHGPDEDQAEDAVRARGGAAALVAWETRGIAPPGWIVDVDARLAAWHRLFATTHDGDLLLVTSNGAARFGLLAAGLSPPSLKLRTGAWGQIRLDAEGRHLVEWDVRPDGGP
jgi:broad specificity phosphatase PhoE